MTIKGKIDLHMHTTVSDGTDAPGEILLKVKEAGIGIFSVTDHDAVKGCAAIRPLLAEGDPVFINGAEFSCRDDEGKYHILGYGYDPEAPSIRALITASHELRMKKIRGRLESLEEDFGVVFPDEEVQELLAMENPGKPHIGNLMVKYGYTATKEEAIHDYINKVRFPDLFLLPEDAIGAIAEAGGIPVLAHPFYGSGDELILGDEMDRRLRRLIGLGIRGVEAFYSGFTDRLRGEMLALADRYDLFVTAGSDYHGRNKLVELGDTGLESLTEIPERLRRFLENVRTSAS